MPSVGEVLGDWTFRPAPMLLAAVAAALYMWAAGRRRWPGWRTACFLAGLTAIVFALGSGLDRYGDRLLSLHMVQHLVLTLVAPPLILTGRPVELALGALHGDARRTLARLLRIPSPLLGWTSFAVVMLGSHAPPIYQAAVRHPALHELEHALYIGTALLFWWPLLDARPRPGVVGRLLYLMLAMPLMGVIGVALSEARSVVYPVYLAPARELHVSALHDQAVAGAIMWSVGAVLMAGIALVVAWLALSAEEARARRREAYEDGRLLT